MLYTCTCHIPSHGCLDWHVHLDVNSQHSSLPSLMYISSSNHYPINTENTGSTTQTRGNTQPTNMNTIWTNGNIKLIYVNTRQTIGTPNRQMIQSNKTSAKQTFSCQISFLYVTRRVCCTQQRLHFTTFRKDFVILQLYWWLFSSTKHCS